MRQFLIRWRSATGHIGETQCYAVNAKEALRRLYQETTILRLSRRIPIEFSYEVMAVIDETYMDGKAKDGVCLHVIE